MKTIAPAEKKNIDDGQLITEGINKGLGGFTPDMMFENMTKNYQFAEKIYGEKIIRMIAGMDPDYIERNIKIPEFQKELKQNIKSKITQMKKDGLLDKDGDITRKAELTSAATVYMDELDNMITKGIFGEKVNKNVTVHGERGGVKNYKKGDFYKDINIRDSLKLATRRGQRKIRMCDLKVNERISKGSLEIIYALDSSASMKGHPLEMAKRAGIALAFKAISERNKVGLIIFGEEIKSSITPTLDFNMILREIHCVRPRNQTNFSKTIEKSIELFSGRSVTKHLIIISDALPTEGDSPMMDTINACSLANDSKITISMVGINLNDEGKELAKRMVEIGEGRFYTTSNSDDLNSIVLQDYNSVSN